MAVEAPAINVRASGIIAEFSIIFSIKCVDRASQEYSNNDNDYY